MLHGLSSETMGWPQQLSKRLAHFGFWISLRKPSRLPPRGASSGYTSIQRLHASSLTSRYKQLEGASVLDALTSLERDAAKLVNELETVGANPQHIAQLLKFCEGTYSSNCSTYSEEVTDVLTRVQNNPFTVQDATMKNAAIWRPTAACAAMRPWMLNSRLLHQPWRQIGSRRALGHRCNIAPFGVMFTSKGECIPSAGLLPLLWVDST